MPFTLDKTTLLLTTFIVVSFIAAWIWISIQKRKDLLLEKKHWIDNLPSIISTLGVLGTFFGITKGLLAFDPNDLNNSIPELLTGLKTAFFTSLAGMIGSLVLTRVVNHAFDNKEKGAFDFTSAATQIVDAINLLSQQNEKHYLEQAKTQLDYQNHIFEKLNQITDFKQSLSNVSDNIEHISNNLPSLADYQKQLTDREAFYKLVAQKFDVINANLQIVIKDVNSQIKANDAIINDLDDVLQKIITIADNSNSSLGYHQRIEDIQSDIKRNTDEMAAHTEAQVNIQQEITTNVGMFGEILHGEVIEIEDCMSNTNKLLSDKFDEFSELLQKSNTESLVEVMKHVTEEFERQMSALVSKLVQENFDQLNKSVERLNTWQIQNKDMIQSLTSQYKNMATSFEGTSDVLDRVSKSTGLLVSNDGKLQQIVSALNQVMVEDEQFIQITKNLTLAAKNAKEDSEHNLALTTSLSNWIQRQRNFADSVQLLIQKLDQINKIKDYGEQFWSGTKKNLEEGVGIIAQGSKTLNDQISILDRQFYNRLNATLSELDICIQAMINGKQ